MNLHAFLVPEDGGLLSIPSLLQFPPIYPLVFQVAAVACALRNIEASCSATEKGR